MLQFLQPIWLTLMAGIIVPVVIHLWQRKPGKVLKVGSVMLLQASSIKHARSFNLSELLLLLLRCLFILLLACLLAQPVWKNQLQADKGKGWVMLAADDAAATYQHFKPRVDSLVKHGHELHFFGKGFDEVSVSDLSNIVPDSTGYWQLLQALQQELPPNFNVHLFTPARLDKFTGSRPATALDLHWHTYTPADSLLRWEAFRYAMERDSTRLVKGESSPAATRYSWEDVNGKEMKPLRLAIYSDQFKEDARYLEAALTAIQQYLGSEMIIEEWTDGSKADWVFWLSEKPAPSAFNKLLRYGTGKVEQVNTTIGSTGINLYKQHISTDTLIADWKSAAGVLLGHKANEYVFNSRFNPAYTNLVWDDAFPGMLLDLLLPQQTKLHDKRILDQQQLLPAKGEITSLHHDAQLPLAKYSWFLIFIVFVLERWLSARRKKEAAYD